MVLFLLWKENDMDFKERIRNVFYYNSILIVTGIYIQKI